MMKNIKRKILCLFGQHHYVEDNRGMYTKYMDFTYHECKFCEKQLIRYRNISDGYTMTQGKLQALKRRNVFMLKLQKRVVLIEKTDSFIYIPEAHCVVTSKKHYFKNVKNVDKHFVFVDYL